MVRTSNLSHYSIPVSCVCDRTVAVTPTKSREIDFGDVTKICHDYTTNGLTSMAAVGNKPFRFVYTSGVTIERDQTKSLPFLAEYRLMRVCLFAP